MHHLVIGGTGFIGGHLVEHLVERGGQVRVLARRAERPTWLPARAELIQGDVSDPATVAAAAEGADLVYVATPLPRAEPNEWAALTVLDVTLRGLVAACQRARVSRLVYVSGVDVYGTNLPGRPVDESFPPAPATAAARLRVAAEAILRSAAGRLPVVIVRPVTVFGPRDEHLTRPLLDAYACPPGPSLVGGGRARLSLVYVRDVARALALAARHPYAIGETLNASGCSTTWRAFIATVCAELGVPTPRPGLPYPLAMLLDRWLPPRPGPLSTAQVGRTRVYTDARLAQLLNYHPAYDLLEAVHETVVWYRRATRFPVPAPAGQPSVAHLPS
jgi:nucleoside-diphosphate-sugar epimerase